MWPSPPAFSSMRLCVTTDLPLPLIVGIAAVLGAVIGSFLNVCILR